MVGAWREAKGLWPGRPRPKRRRKGSYAHLRGLDQLYGPRNTKRQADHRADRPRRRDRRETRAEVGAGLLDRGTLRHGRRLRGTRRGSHERPPPGDQQLYGHHTNHHAPSLRRARDVGHPPEDRLSRPTSENLPWKVSEKPRRCQNLGLTRVRIWAVLGTENRPNPRSKAYSNPFSDGFWTKFGLCEVALLDHCPRSARHGSGAWSTGSFGLMRPR